MKLGRLLQLGCEADRRQKERREVRRQLSCSRALSIFAGLCLGG